MKKIYYSTIIAGAVLSVIGAQTTLAQTTSTPYPRFEKRQEQLDERKEKLEDRKEKLASTTAKIEDRIKEREMRIATTEKKLEDRAEKRASSTEMRKARLEERFKTGVANQIARVNDKLGDAIARIKSIDERIKARIANMKSRNIDTSKSEALLVDAQAKLTTATDKVNALRTSLESTLATNISSSTKSTIKTKTAEVNTAVKAAHAAYVKVIESLKPGLNKVSTSTATSTI